MRRQTILVDGARQELFAHIHKNALKKDITLYDLLGNKIWEQNDASGTSIVMNIDYLHKGIYLIKFVSEYETGISKIILE